MKWNGGIEYGMDRWNGIWMDGGMEYGMDSGMEYGWIGGMEYGMDWWNGIWNGMVEWNMEWNGGMEYGMDSECYTEQINHVTDALLSPC